MRKDQDRRKIRFRFRHFTIARYIWAAIIALFGIGVIVGASYLSNWFAGTAITILIIALFLDF